MPERGVVTIGGFTIEVKPFYWPAAPLRIGVHDTAAGRLIEVDTTTRLQDVEILLEGDEQTGWRLMTDTMRANIETLFQAGAAFTVVDWRGNTGTFFFLEAPTFGDLAGIESAPLTAYWTFSFRLGRIT
jgi:hypothetical protein